MSLQAFSNMIARVKSLRTGINNSIMQSIEKNRPAWEQMQRDRISEGKNTQEKDLSYNKPRRSPLNDTGAYTRQYSRTRSKEGLQTRVVDLKRTGNYQNQIKAKGTKGKVYFESNDEKEKFIEANYDKVLGFTPEEKKEVFRMVGEDIKLTVRKAFLG